MIGCINAFAKQCCSLCVFVTNESDVLNYCFRLCGRPPRLDVCAENKTKTKKVWKSLCLCLSVSALSLSLSNTHTHSLSLSVSLSLLFCCFTSFCYCHWFAYKCEKNIRAAAATVSRAIDYAQCGIPAKNKRMIIRANMENKNDRLKKL